MHQILDNAGTRENVNLADAWGQQVPIGWTPGLADRFTGLAQREMDDESGLQYTRARHYAPSLGRFVQRDPVSHTFIYAEYRYGRNRPSRVGDPSGMSDIDLLNQRYSRENVGPWYDANFHMEVAAANVTTAGSRQVGEVTDASGKPVLGFDGKPLPTTDAAFPSSTVRYWVDFEREFAAGTVQPSRFGYPHRGMLDADYFHELAHRVQQTWTFEHAAFVGGEHYDMLEILVDMMAIEGIGQSKFPEGDKAAAFTYTMSHLKGLAAGLDSRGGTISGAWYDYSVAPPQHPIEVVNSTIRGFFAAPTRWMSRAKESWDKVSTRDFGGQTLENEWLKIFHTSRQNR